MDHLQQQQVVIFKINIRKKEKEKKYCQNCGHNCHCGGYCFQDYDEKKETLCCTHCRHEEKQEKITDPEALFNGA